MSTPVSRNTSILIIGAGTWGISTALHLARRGYQETTILDLYPVPSLISAGNDVNKIVEQCLSKSRLYTCADLNQGYARATSFAGTNDDEIYVSRKLYEAAIKGWLSDPIFKPYYHDTGYVVAASSAEGLARLREREETDGGADFVKLGTPEQFHNTMPKGVLTGDFPGWKGWYKSTGAGWVHARKSLIAAAKEAERLGVKFVTGSPQGEVTGLLFDNGDVKGAITADGVKHYADRTILCVGANADGLLDFKKQLRPTAWTISHIKMHKEEVALYKDLPVLFNIESGFFMEPDEDNHELKICDEHPGYCNWVRQPDGSRRSVPFAKHQIPIQSEKRVRAFLKETMPHLAERPLTFARICWCADTPNRSFLIAQHPDYPSLVLGVGASGHGFKDIPSIGGFIVDCLEGQLDPKMAKSFRWRPETARNRNWEDTQGRFGGPGRVMDFGEVTEWTEIRYKSQL